MSLGVNLDYTYNGKETLEVFIKPALQNPNILSLFNVRNNVRNKEQLFLLGTVDKLVKADSGACAASPQTKLNNITNKTLQTCRMTFWLDQCASNFKDYIFNEWLKMGKDINDLEGTDVQRIYEGMLKDALNRDFFRIMTLGDTNSADADYSQCDGLWTRIFAGVADYTVTKAVTLPQSGNLAAGAALTNLRIVWEGADIILKQLPNNEKFFWVTGSVFDNLLTSYESNTTGSEDQFALLQKGPDTKDGTPTLMYRGISVVPVYAWDNYIAADSLGNPHRILYSTPSNHVIGLEKADDITDMEMWYERKDQLFNFRGHFVAGYQYIHDGLSCVAY